ncbi:MAG TPA: MFS transporter [Solirubrobacteraceae bacterium]|jgi:EmrB/QacA subfamily drug resistance transporter
MQLHDGPARKWWTLAAVCVATFMLLIDITIVNVALPDIRSALGSSFSDLQWVIDAYALTLAAFLLTWGSTSDRLGRRLIFVVGLVIFVCASLACALATSPLFLNLARAVQGVGAAAMFATSLALLASAFHGRERGTAVGIWGATIGAAVAIGPLVGGLLTESVGWESIFYINVPIGLGAIYIALTRVAESKDPDAGPTDWAGLVTFSGGLFLLIFALVRGNPEGWGSPLIVSFLVGAAVLLAAFIVVEARVAHPMFDLALFRVPTFGGASIAAFALSASLFSMFLYLTLYIQNSLGYSPLEAGLRFLPLSLLSFFVAPLAGRLSARVPIRALIGGGMLLVTVSLLLMRGLNASSDWTALLAGFCLAGIGTAFVNPSLASTAVSVVPPQRAGMGSGINSTFRQIGIATGTAGLGALFQGLLADRATGRLAHVPAEVLAQGRPEVAGPGGREAYLTLFTGALNDLFLIAAIIAFAGAVLSFALIRGRDFIASGPAVEEESEPEAEAAAA